MQQKIGGYQRGGGWEKGEMGEEGWSTWYNWRKLDFGRRALWSIYKCRIVMLIAVLWTSTSRLVIGSLYLLFSPTSRPTPSFHFMFIWGFLSFNSSPFGLQKFLYTFPTQECLQLLSWSLTSLISDFIIWFFSYRYDLPQTVSYFLLWLLQRTPC